MHTSQVWSRRWVLTWCMACVYRTQSQKQTKSNSSTQESPSVPMLVIARPDTPLQSGQDWSVWDRHQAESLLAWYHASKLYLHCHMLRRSVCLTDMQDLVRWLWEDLVIPSNADGHVSGFQFLTLTNILIHLYVWVCVCVSLVSNESLSMKQLFLCPCPPTEHRSFWLFYHLPVTSYYY